MLRLVFCLFFLASTAHANETLLARYMPSPEKVGEGTLSVMFWDAYKAELYAPNGQYQDGQPVALKLTYLMDFEGADIADRSASEMRDHTRGGRDAIVDDQQVIVGIQGHLVRIEGTLTDWLGL